MLKSHFDLPATERNVIEEETTDEERPGKNELQMTKQELTTEEIHGEEAGEGGAVEDWQVPEVFPERKLHKSEVSVRLSLLGKTAEGDGYTYLKAACTGMNLTDISAIKSFPHLQFLDVSNNNLNLDSLQVITELPYLVLIHADKNILNSAALKRMKYMQVIIMNNNRITSVHDVCQPELCTLEVGYNQITKIAFDSHMPHIKCLDFRYNLITEISNLNFPNLDSLYLAGNNIISLIGIEKLTNLRVLHVRNNPIKLLNGFHPELKKLQYLNLRSCKVSTLIQIKKLKVLPSLDTLIMKGCPYMGGTGEDPETGGEEEDPEIRIEILATLPRLKRINKGVITPEERTEATTLMKQWIEEGENDEEEVEEEQQETESNED